MILRHRLVKRTREDGQIHSHTMLFSQPKAGIVCMFAPATKSEEMRTRLVSYCGLKKYQTKSQMWVGLGMLIDAPGILHALVTIRKPWAHDPNMEELVSKCLQPLPSSV